MYKYQSRDLIWLIRHISFLNFFLEYWILAEQYSFFKYVEVQFFIVFKKFGLAKSDILAGDKLMNILFLGVINSLHHWNIFRRVLVNISAPVFSQFFKKKGKKKKIILSYYFFVCNFLYG